MVTQKISWVIFFTKKHNSDHTFSDPNLYLVEAPALKPAEIIMDPEQVSIIKS